MSDIFGLGQLVVVMLLCAFESLTSLCCPYDLGISSAVGLWLLRGQDGQFGRGFVVVDSKFW